MNISRSRKGKFKIIRKEQDKICFLSMLQKLFEYIFLKKRSMWINFQLNHSAEHIRLNITEHDIRFDVHRRRLTSLKWKKPWPWGQNKSVLESALLLSSLTWNFWSPITFSLIVVKYIVSSIFRTHFFFKMKMAVEMIFSLS